MILKDIFHTPYFNEDGSVSPECRLFVGWKQEAIEKYLQNRQEGI